MKKRVVTPLTPEQIKNLHAGDSVLISGVIYTARDAAHKRLVELLDKGEALPCDLKGKIIYYVGPSPAKPGDVIGAAGPTTSYRMDAYAPRLMREAGLLGMIGKGSRSKEVTDAITELGGVYFAAIGGAAALLASTVKSCEVIAYPDLDSEAVRRLEVVDFPATVINDSFGGNLYEQGREEYLSSVDGEAR